MEESIIVTLERIATHLAAMCLTAVNSEVTQDNRGLERRPRRRGERAGSIAGANVSSTCRLCTACWTNELSKSVRTGGNKRQL